MKNYYQILEVDQRASKEVIEKAYRTLVKKYHPDLYATAQKKEAEMRLRELNEAYNILSDDFLREQYDFELRKESIRKEENQSSNQNTNDVQNEKTKEKTDSKRKIMKKKNDVGTIFGIIELIKEIFNTTPRKSRKQNQTRKESKGIDKTDFMALGLTIVVIIIIGVILWLIPFTNGWMRQLLFENPIFKLIGSLFGEL